MLYIFLTAERKQDLNIKRISKRHKYLLIRHINYLLIAVCRIENPRNFLTNPVIDLFSIYNSYSILFFVRVIYIRR